ncbi:TetR family transcriptional regulator [Thioclava sp. BHET1]|nr:TetR family transcriptional regulator [Thioclava sp. BHET1]
MANERRRFRREGEAQRQGDLIAAVLELIAEGGPQAATVRAIAERAGVTPGLIRHYFKTKEELLGAAYAHFVNAMTEAHQQAAAEAPPDPLLRLASFVAQSLHPPMVDARMVGLWAGFLHLIRHDPALLQVHRDGYLTFRDQLQTLIADAQRARGRQPDAAALRADAIAANALIDGLWLEGSLLPDDFHTSELARTGLSKIGLLLDLPLLEAAAARDKETNG